MRTPVLIAPMVALALGLASAFGAAPSISAVIPASGNVGSMVTIEGGNFSAIAEENKFFFGGVHARVSQASLEGLEVIVPIGAAYAPITVQRNGLMASSKTPLKKPLTQELGNEHPTGNRCRPQCVRLKFEVWRLALSKCRMPTFKFQMKAVRNSTFGIRNLAAQHGTACVHVSSIISPARGVHAFVVTFPSDQVLDATRFGPRVDYSAQSHPTTIALGDLDGDGHLDVAFPNYQSSSLSLFRNRA